MTFASDLNTTPTITRVFGDELSLWVEDEPSTGKEDDADEESSDDSSDDSDKAPSEEEGPADPELAAPVSYTHLTLPTICSV